MNANINPFMTCDMTKIMTDFDTVKFADTYQVPEFNVSCLIDAQSKNMEALSGVNKAAVEGF